MFLERQPDLRQYDLIMGDAFNDYSVPYHLTTQEFNERVKAWLADDGLYMVNMIDGLHRDFLRAYIHTLQQTFEHVYVIPASTAWQRLAADDLCAGGIRHTDRLERSEGPGRGRRRDFVLGPGSQAR